jgi:hypothetical protein
MMRDINDLRHALDAETADLTVHLPADLIRRRARRVRMRQASVVAAAAVLAVAALAVPTVLLSDGSSPGYDAAGQMPQVPWCPAPSPSDSIPSLGPLVETGVTLDAPNVNTRYDVLLGLTGTRDQPGFVIAFRDRHTGMVEPWDTTVLGRGAKGDFPGKRAGDPAHQFQSSQLTLGPKSVLDVGLYSRAAHRITVTSQGRATAARTALNAATGWTFFWAQRAAAPLPPGHNTTPDEYHGPEQLTLTAYDADGRPQHTVKGGFDIGHNVQNPRDHQPSDEGKPSKTRVPTCPPAANPT